MIIHAISIWISISGSYQNLFPLLKKMFPLQPVKLDLSELVPYRPW